MRHVRESAWLSFVVSFDPHKDKDQNYSLYSPSKGVDKTLSSKGSKSSGSFGNFEFPLCCFSCFVWDRAHKGTLLELTRHPA